MTVATSVPAANAAKSAKRSGSRTGLALLAAGLIACACSQSATSTKGTIAPHASTPANATAALHARPSPGCTSSTRSEVTLARRTVTVDGTQRWFLISTPPGASATRPTPVVLDFHGLAEGAEIEAETTQFSPLGQKDGFISVFPEGTGNPVSWNTSADTRTNHDLAFVSDMLDQIEATECVDETSIYATGLSDGAFMTSTLACAMSNRIAAFAPVSGVQLAIPCAAKRRVPILAFHGTADPILYFNGGVGVGVLKHALTGKGAAPSISVPAAKLDGPGYPATVAAWAKRDGCGSVPVDTKVTPHVIQRVYRCPPGTAVEFYIVLGGGHAWPGSEFSEKIAAITGPTTFEIDASEIIWAFFERFHL
jgi:polyhydroxybutyrate depolymerase